MEKKIIELFDKGVRLKRIITIYPKNKVYAVLEKYTKERAKEWLK